MERRQESQIEILMDSLKHPIRQAMRRDPDLMHKAYSLEARTATAEILGKQEEFQTLIVQYSTLSTEVRKKLGTD